MGYPKGLLACLLVPGFAAAQQAAPEEVPVPGAAECEVWARETSFARSVAAHDPGAFREHLDEGVVFGAKSPTPRRGRDAVVEAWAGIIDGSALALDWYPTRVAVDGSGELAYSSGPALYGRVGGQGAEYRLGAFQSIWRRGSDGVWRVVFDDGIHPQPASAQEVEAFRAGRRATCPRA
ncbi:MAG: DUF4440 domain-containing protein [Luteimonas sp.]|nr:DUF4440 domain-containing protein [Luteimonas sp.]